MGKTANLIPFNAMTADRQRELSKRGGKASGAARREKRDLINREKARMIAANELKWQELQTLRQSTRDLAIAARLNRGK